MQRDVSVQTCACLSCFQIQLARTLIECVCMLSVSHVVDTYPANTSEPLESGEGMQPYQTSVWLPCSCEEYVFLVVRLEFAAIARYTFGVCCNCQIPVRSLWPLPDTRSESGAGPHLIMDTACLDSACPICQTEVDWAVYPGNRWTSTCSMCGCVHTFHGGNVTLDTTACVGRRASKQTTSVAPVIRFKCMACRSTSGAQKVLETHAAVSWVLKVYGCAWLHPFDHLRVEALCSYCRLAGGFQVHMESAICPAEPRERHSGTSTSAICLAEPREMHSGASSSALWLEAPAEERVSHGARASDDAQAEAQMHGSSSSPRLRALLMGNKIDGDDWQ